MKSCNMSLSASYKIVNGQVPLYLSQSLPKKKVLSDNLQKKPDFQVPSVRTSKYKNIFSFLFTRMG